MQVAARIRRLRAGIRARLALRGVDILAALRLLVVDIRAALLVADVRVVPVVVRCMPADPAVVREARLRRGHLPVIRRPRVAAKCTPRTEA
jgi:hypothetical protein